MAAADPCAPAPLDLHVGLQQIGRKIASGCAKSPGEMYCVSLNASFLPISAERFRSRSAAVGSARVCVSHTDFGRSHLGGAAPRNAAVLQNTKLLQGASKWLS